ncbi:CinA family protein [Desulfonatronovibrio hydrogenovorans]|uniref:CinA family protein n=1 Tax=Desulfonatronovibrio hydrogenovorans TaxID=53245 RepID=UPI000491BF1A|nr:CinA family protein [Desulfonatronovibrio hydrogenovorans]
MEYEQPMIKVLAGRMEAERLFLATAESCTGGLISHLLTNEPGSSRWYAGGVVAYSNHLKTSILGVDQELLNGFGAVSSQCVEAMVRGVISLTSAQAGIAVSGIAGPGGGTLEKPVGTVYMAWGLLERIRWKRFVFQGQRLQIKEQASAAAIQGLLDFWD